MPAPSLRGGREATCVACRQSVRTQGCFPTRRAGGATKATLFAAHAALTPHERCVKANRKRGTRLQAPARDAIRHLETQARGAAQARGHAAQHRRRQPGKIRNGARTQPLLLRACAPAVLASARGATAAWLAGRREGVAVAAVCAAAARCVSVDAIARVDTLDEAADVRTEQASGGVYDGRHAQWPRTAWQAPAQRDSADSPPPSAAPRARCSWSRRRCAHNDA